MSGAHCERNPLFSLLLNFQLLAESKAEFFNNSFPLTKIACFTLPDASIVTSIKTSPSAFPAIAFAGYGGLGAEITTGKNLSDANLQSCAETLPIAKSTNVKINNVNIFVLVDIFFIIP